MVLGCVPWRAKAVLMKLFIPFIALILLRNIGEFAEGAASVRDEFDQDHRELVCGRSDVYSRNLKDSFLYLASKFPELKNQAMPDFDQDKDLDCGEAAYAVYHENNPGLPALYPNWRFLERGR